MCNCLPFPFLRGVAGPQKLQAFAKEAAKGVKTGDDRAELLRLRKEVKELRMGKEILKKASAFFAREVKFGFIDEMLATYPVRLLCRVMKVGKSAFYSWRKCPRVRISREDLHLNAL